MVMYVLVHIMSDKGFKDTFKYKLTHITKRCNIKAEMKFEIKKDRF